MPGDVLDVLMFSIFGQVSGPTSLVCDALWEHLGEVGVGISAQPER